MEIEQHSWRTQSFFWIYYFLWPFENRFKLNLSCREVNKLFREKKGLAKQRKNVGAVGCRSVRYELLLWWSL